MPNSIPTFYSYKLDSNFVFSHHLNLGWLIRRGGFPFCVVIAILFNSISLYSQPIEKIVVNEIGDGFCLSESKQPIDVLGFNYDHDRDGRLIEDYWIDEWKTVVSDFKEMAALGANVVRIHLQYGRFFEAPDRPQSESVEQLRQLIKLAENTGLYLNLTGLGCYHKKDVPDWYDELSESERWNAQSKFWETIASVASGSQAVFCYDLMNEPILAGRDKVETDWLGKEFGGKHFVQRITRNLKGRNRKEVARLWVEKLTTSIRKHDKETLVTVGVIPWAHVFPGAKPLFYQEKTRPYLDFVSVHFYPEKEAVDKALQAIQVYELGMPLIVEEFFPLKCSLDEMDSFMSDSESIVDGWISFYWGQTIEEYQSSNKMPEALIGEWLNYLSKHWEKPVNTPSGK